MQTRGHKETALVVAEVEVTSAPRDNILPLSTIERGFLFSRKGSTMTNREQLARLTDTELVALQVFFCAVADTDLDAQVERISSFRKTTMTRDMLLDYLSQIVDLSNNK